MIIKRVVKRLHYFNLKRGVKSFDRFNQQHFKDQIDSNLLAQNQSTIKPIYEKYINEVSSPNMAASLELAAFMYTICILKRYKKILDLGSGLSSIIFRKYAQENSGVTVYSVDDDVNWLEKTKNSLRSYQLEVTNLYSFSQFYELDETGFDCILYDLNLVEIRIKHIAWVNRLLSRHGLIILDDIHKKDYYHSLLEEMKDLNMDFYSLKPVTLDYFGRYALAAVIK